MKSRSMNRRRSVSSLSWVAAFVAALLGPAAARAQSSDAASVKKDVFPPAPLRDWAAMRLQVERGLRFLESRQSQNGAIGSSYQVAVTSLAGLAALGAGHQPGADKELGKLLEKAFQYLNSSARPVGSGVFITEGDESKSRMHGHCYAVLFLCELYGSLPGRDEEVANLIKKAVTVIERSQSIEGGWYYLPDGSDPNLDEASVTVCALQALRAAHNVGILVDGRRIDRARAYVRHCQMADGSFRYSLCRAVDGNQRTSFALSAAAISTLNAAGVYRSPELQKGLDYLHKELDRARSPWNAAEAEHDFYANLYAAQAFYQEAGPLWESWYTKVREHLLKKQRSDGSWENRPYGDEYATAVALLILEVPLGYLPIFQR